MKNKFVYLGMIQVFVAVWALPAGLSMITNPTGMGLGMSPQLLSDSPFDSFLIPGLFLFFVNGLANVLGAFLSFKRHLYAGILGLALGIFLVLWIVAQVYFIGFAHFLQPLFMLIGLIECWLGYRISRYVTRGGSMSA